MTCSCCLGAPWPPQRTGPCPSPSVGHLTTRPPPPPSCCAGPSSAALSNELCGTPRTACFTAEAVRLSSQPVSLAAHGSPAIGCSPSSPPRACHGFQPVPTYLYPLYYTSSLSSSHTGTLPVTSYACAHLHGCPMPPASPATDERPQIALELISTITYHQPAACT